MHYNDSGREGEREYDICWERGGAIIRMKICQIGISKFWYVVQSTFKYVACVCSNAGILFCGRGRGEG